MKRDFKKSNSGFTLIETLIYLGLFGILIGGISVTAYAIVEATGRDQTRIIAQEEGGFLLGKLNWALTGASSIKIPATGVPAPSLSIDRYVGTNPLVFDLNASKLRIKVGTGGSAIDLNSDAVQVVNLVFTDIPSANGKPQGVTIKFTLRSKTPRGATIDQDFETTKFLR